MEKIKSKIIIDSVGSNIQINRINIAWYKRIINWIKGLIKC